MATSISNLSALKKLPVGTKITLVRCRTLKDASKYPSHTEDDWQDTPHRALGVQRTIVKAQTNAFTFSPVNEQSKPSWFYFPKAAYISPRPQGFLVRPEDGYGYELEYKVEMV